ncbi:hypothetical protein ACOME3_008550 [Neoechinorhynchus agilis]
MRYPRNINFLYLNKTPRYPLWQPNDPRHRLFLPQFWMRLMSGRHLDNNPLPPFTLTMECHIEMTKSDIKQYLEKIYNIGVLDVNTEIVAGKENRNPRGGFAPPDNPRKFAYVQLREELNFQFPDIFAKKFSRSSERSLTQYAKTRNNAVEQMNQALVEYCISLGSLEKLYYKSSYWIVVCLKKKPFLRAALGTVNVLLAHWHFKYRAITALYYLS